MPYEHANSRVVRRPSIRLLMALIVGFIAFNVLVPPRSAAANGVFLVDSVLDNNVHDGELNLREAILAANGTLTRSLSNSEKASLTGCTFSGSNNNWFISGGCGLGIQDTISLIDNLQINLNSALPTLTDDSTYIGPLPGLTVKINGQNLAGNIFAIEATDVIIEGLRLYGTTGSVVWIRGSGTEVEIKNNVIGDDDPALGGCGQSPNAATGVKVTDNPTTANRAWIHGNVIECIAGNPGDGLALAVNARLVFVGENTAGSAGGSQRNNIGYNARDGVHIETGASDNTVRNSTIHENGRNGVFLAAVSQNRVYGNTIESNILNGVAVVAGATFNRIGCLDGSDPNSNANRNHIRFNAGNGVRLADAGTFANQIFCNWVGVRGANGDQNAGNELDGILIEDGAFDNQIGGQGYGNVISGNSWYGIEIRDSGTDDNLVYANIIGLNAAGDQALPNERSGVFVRRGAADSHIGDINGSWQGNVISGNYGYGVEINGSNINLLEYNLIGLSASGDAPIPNQIGGVFVRSGVGNTIGTLTAGAEQFISGNLNRGITVFLSASTFIGLSNYIGVAGDRVTPMGNEDAGILLSDSFNSAVFPSFIGYNGGGGVAVVGGASVDNVVTPEEVRGNDGLAIDLGDDGHTPNDPGDGDGGPNDLLNYPEVTTASGSSISGTACANCKVLIYEAYGDPSQPGGGGLFLSNVTANGSGAWSAVLPGGRTLDDVTLMACEASCYLTGQSSEFSPRPVSGRIYLPLVLRN